MSLSDRERAEGFLPCFVGSVHASQPIYESNAQVQIQDPVLTGILFRHGSICPPMTDDSTSQDTEDEESAEEERRPADTEETPRRRDEEKTHGKGEEPEHEPDIETAMDAEQPIDNESSINDGPAVDNEPSTDDAAHEQTAIPDNPMAGIEAEPEERADPDSRNESDPGVSPAPAGDGPVDDQQTSSSQDFIPDDVQKYERFKKMDGARYDRVNEFLRDRTYITAREWAIARLCSDFRTETGIEMTKIGENLPRLVPFMNDTYTPQAVNQARHSFEEKVRKSGATFLYGAMSGFFTAEQLDDVMYEITEVAKFLLEVEGVDLSVEEELEAEDRILSVMREVREQSEQLRHEGTTCPECGHEIGAEGDE